MALIASTVAVTPASVKAGQAQNSVVEVSTAVPYNTIKAIAVAKLPDHFDFSGGGNVACLNIPHVNPGHVGSHRECKFGVCINVPDFTGPSLGTQRACADYSWRATVRREGDPLITGSGPALHVEVPIRVDGSAGLSGDLARILSLSAKNFEAHAHPGVDVTFALDENWCPIIHAMPTADNWVTNAQVEVIGRNCVGLSLGPFGNPQICAGPINVDLDKEANPAMGSVKNTVKGSIEQAVSCDRVRDTISPYWKTLSVALPGLPNGQGFLNVTPQGAALSALTPESAGLRISGGLIAKTAISATSIPVQQLELPKLKLIGTPIDGLSLDLNVPLSFDLIQKASLSILANQKFTQPTPLGTLDLAVLDVRVSSKESALVIGVKLSAKLAGTSIILPDWIDVIATPQIEPGASELKLDNLRVEIDSQDATLISVGSVIQNQVLAGFKSPVEILNFKSQREDVAKRLQDAINGYSVPGATLTAGQPQISVGNLSVTPENLVVDCGVTIPLNVELKPEFFATR